MANAYNRSLTPVRFNGDNLRYCGLQNGNVASILSDLLIGKACGVTYPFKIPPNARAKSATGKVGANPNMTMLRPVPAMPVRRIGFRPTRSLSLPQNILAKNSAIAKAEVIIPAYMVIWRSSLVILNDFTM
jgi:hypothetical protein